MYEKELQNLGLSEKEARVYLAALELGPDTAQNIAAKAGINRPTAYLQIESLKDKGLMSEVQKGKKTYFTAEPPERLLSLLDITEKQTEVKRAELERTLPMLREMSAGAGDRPKVRFFEGPEGQKAMQEDFLSVKDKKIESFINLDKLFETFPQIEDEYTKRRIAKGIKSSVIYTRRAGPLESATDSRKLRTAKFVSSERLPISADIGIYDDKISLANYSRSRPIGVIIEDKEISNTIRALFYMIWNSI